MIQVTQDGWVLTLAHGRDLTINGYGITRTYKIQGMSLDELQGFMDGWSAYHKMVRADSPIQAEPYPVFQ